MKYARLTLSLLAAGLLAACSSAPSTDGQGAGFELADAAVELVAHLVDAQAGFLVVKQAGVGLASREADEQAGHQRGQKAGEHQNSPE